MRLLASITLVLILTLPACAGVLPATAAFLTELGIDPTSQDVTSIADDVVNNKDVQNVSLNSLAALRDQEGVKRFIATRNFIHKYMRNAQTAFPPTQLYESLYLNKPEQDFVFCQIANGMNAKNVGC